MKKYPDFVETNKDANGEINLSEELLAYIRENNFDDPIHNKKWLLQILLISKTLDFLK